MCIRDRSWGTEFATQPTDQQYEIADFLFENGADIIIGGHCRVPQPMELRTVKDADGNERKGFICYSCLLYTSYVLFAG